ITRQQTHPTNRTSPPARSPKWRGENPGAGVTKILSYFLWRVFSTKRTSKPLSPGLTLFVAICVIALALAPIASVQAKPEIRGRYVGRASGIRYFGRVQRGADVLWTWPGTGLRVVYSNSVHVKLRLRAENFDEDSSRNTIRMVWYKIDDGPWISF